MERNVFGRRCIERKQLKSNMFMKKWNWMRLRLMPLFAAFLLLLGCTGSKAERKLLKDAASEIYSELEKSAKEASSETERVTICVMLLTLESCRRNSAGSHLSSLRRVSRKP